MTFAGIDIGGSKVGLGLVSEGRLQGYVSFPTGSADEVVRQIASWLPSDVAAMGVGCPGPMDEDAGRLLNVDTLPGWEGFELVAALEQGTGRRVALLNDADAALLGELADGSLSEYRCEPCAMLTFGTGVGGALWDGTRRVRGASGLHPELGHMLVNPGCRPCYCGAHGCLEAEASGTALGAGARIADAALAVDVALWNLAHMLQPAAIALGGGLIEGYGAQLARERELVAPMLARPVKVVHAALGNRAGVVGAAWHARERFHAH